MRTAPVFACLVLAACTQSPSTPAGPRLASVSTRDVIVSAVAAGVVEPVTTVEVKSKASGEIIEVRVEEGDRVTQGQLLVRVDPRIPGNAVAQAEADSLVARAELDNAEAQLVRADALKQSQAITQLEYEQAKLTRATAYAALVRARRALEDSKIAYEDTEVRAPAGGVILGRKVEVGSVIASASRDVGGGAVLLRMATLDTVQVRALVDETDIGMVQPGLRTTIQVSSFANRRFEGRVLRIGAEAVVEQNVTLFPVLIRIANPEHLLRPGMNAEVEIHIGEAREVLAVPNSALRPPRDVPLAAELLGLSPDDVRRQLEAQRATLTANVPAPTDGAAPALGGEYVAFVMRDGQPQAVRVHVSLTDFDYSAIVSGLVAGDTVVVLPTTGMIQDQRDRETWMRERVGGPLSGGGRR